MKLEKKLLVFSLIGILILIFLFQLNTFEKEYHKPSISEDERTDNLPLILFFIIVGIVLGTVTGLIPGIHTNLIAVLIIGLSPSLLNYITPLSLGILIVSIAITNTFVDFIPSIYFGAPDEETSLSVLPGHDLLLRGQGHLAIIYTLIGSSIAIVSMFLFIPVFSFILPKIYPFIERMMAWILIWISFFLIYGEKNNFENKKIIALIFFLSSGFLGLAVLNNGSINQPLLPLLSGLFGSSTIIYSLSKNKTPPPQIIEKIKLNKKELVKPTIATTLISPFCSFLPGLGSNQAAIIATKVFKKFSKKQFLILLGSINTFVVGFSFYTLYLFEKTRTGAAKAISEIIKINNSNIFFIAFTIILVSLISIIITLNISKLFARNIHKMNYRAISKTILVLLTLIILIVSNIQGLLVFITSTFLGLACITFNTKRSFLMGCLLIPTIIFYLPF